MHNGSYRKNNAIKRGFRIKDYTMRQEINKKPKNKSKENKSNRMKQSKSLSLNNQAITDRNRKARIMMRISQCSSWFSF